MSLRSSTSHESILTRTPPQPRPASWGRDSGGRSAIVIDANKDGDKNVTKSKYYYKAGDGARDSLRTLWPNFFFAFP